MHVHRYVSVYSYIKYDATNSLHCQNTYEFCLVIFNGFLEDNLFSLSVKISTFNLFVILDSKTENPNTY